MNPLPAARKTGNPAPRPVLIDTLPAFMPELPEVEIYRRYFDRHALHQPIVGVRVKDARILGGTRAPALRRALNGQTFFSTRRHGKHLFAGTENGTWLRIHFGMTGDLFYYRGASSPARFPRVIVDFEENAHMAYDDARLFGVVDLVASPERFIAERGLGPDPLDKRFNAAAFSLLLENRRGAIKALLMKQEIIAGLGNLYVDEILFQTSIHPRRPAASISTDQRKIMYKAMKSILLGVIQRKSMRKGYPPRFLIPHREEGDRCPICGGTIQRTIVFGRTTYFCGKHQKN